MADSHKASGTSCTLALQFQLLATANGDPARMYGRFLDLQLSHYHTPGFDLTYFLYTCVGPEVRRTKHKYLLETYLGSLNRSLDLYGYEGPRLDLESLEDAMTSVFMLTFFAVTCVLAAASSDLLEGFDLETVLRSQGTDGVDPTIYGEAFKQRAGDIVRDMADYLSS